MSLILLFLLLQLHPCVIRYSGWGSEWRCQAISSRVGYQAIRTPIQEAEIRMEWRSIIVMIVVRNFLQSCEDVRASKWLITMIITIQKWLELLWNNLSASSPTFPHIFSNTPSSIYVWPVITSIVSYSPPARLLSSTHRSHLNTFYAMQLIFSLLLESRSHLLDSWISFRY